MLVKTLTVVLISIISISTALQAFSSNETAVNVEARLVEVKEWDIEGYFAMFDFDNVPAAWDWTYQVYGTDLIFQLQGNEPTDNDVFGWKQVYISPNEPMWYMFSLGADVDGDGSGKFDWVLFYIDDQEPAVYKLSGVSDTGNFDYSRPLDITYKISEDGSRVLVDHLPVTLYTGTKTYNGVNDVYDISVNLATEAYCVVVNGMEGCSPIDITRLTSNGITFSTNPYFNSACKHTFTGELIGGVLSGLFTNHECANSPEGIFYITPQIITGDDEMDP